MVRRDAKRISSRIWIRMRSGDSKRRQQRVEIPRRERSGHRVCNSNERRILIASVSPQATGIEGRIGMTWTIPICQRCVMRCKQRVSDRGAMRLGLRSRRAVETRRDLRVGNALNNRIGKRAAR